MSHANLVAGNHPNGLPLQLDSPLPRTESNVNPRVEELANTSATNSLHCTVLYVSLHMDQCGCAALHAWICGLRHMSHFSCTH